MSAALTPELEALIQGYADGTLSPDEAHTLLAELKAEPELAATVLSALHWDQFIRDTVKLQKIDELLPESSKASADTFKSGAYDHVPVHSPARDRSRMLWFALGAAALFAVAVLFFRNFAADSRAPIAEVRSVAHTRIEHSGSATDAEVGTNVFDGDTLTIGAGGSASVFFADGTRTDFAANSVVQICGAQPNTTIPAGKKVFLTSGELSASVAPQPAERPFVFITPQAQSVVIGTELKIAVQNAATRLDVNKGKVRITSTSSGKSVDVSAGEFALAAPNVELSAAPQRNVAARQFAVGSGIAGAWQLGTGPGALPDDSGQGNPGIAYGNPQAGDEPIGKALRLDGDTQFVELEKRGAYDALTSGTVMAWIRCEAPPREGRQMTIFSAENGASEMFEFAVKNDQLIVWAGRAHEQNHEWTDNLAGAAPLTNLNAWHHVAYVVSENGNAFYIDGVRAPASFTSGSPDEPFFLAQALTSAEHNTRYRIGASVDTLEECFHGAMADVRIYSRALTETEIHTAAHRN